MLQKQASSIRLLCAADLHLGRILPHSLEEKSKENFILNAWTNLVALAGSSSVDAVLLAGDIFDSEDNLYEAVFQFEKGVVELAKKGIPVLAVAGNHDARLFAKRSYFPHLPQFKVLGKNGVWESHSLTVGQRTLRIDGWSFPDERYIGNPILTSLPCSREEIAIGLLHCECPGAKDSVYAPVGVSDFAKTGHRAWILGHVHIPQQLLQQPDVFYCGSLQGLDSSEHGPRGAMVLDIDSAGGAQRQFCPLAPLLWHRQEVEVDPSVDLFTFLERLAQERLKNDLNKTRAFASSFVLQGRVRDYLSLAQRAQELEGQHLTSILNDQNLIPCWIERISVDCQPAYDLSLLSQGEDMISLLARKLLELQKKEGEAAILKKAHGALEQKAMKYPHLAQTGPSNEEEIRSECLRAGYALLADLLKQKEGSR